MAQQVALLQAFRLIANETKSIDQLVFVELAEILASLLLSRDLVFPILGNQTTRTNDWQQVSQSI